MRTLVIHQFSKHTGVPAKTIRYYEGLGLLPRARRAANNYRQYGEADVERFIAGARNLGFSLADIAEILAAFDTGAAPCQRVLETITRRLSEVDRRIADLLSVRTALIQLQTEGSSLPQGGTSGERCICDLLKRRLNERPVAIQTGTFLCD